MDITKEAALAAISRFVQEFGRFPTKNDCKNTDWLASAQTYQRLLGHRENYQYILDEYKLENPSPLKPVRHCKQCNEIIEDRPGNSPNIFCSKSCAATFNNPRKPARTKKQVKVANVVYKLKEVKDYGECVHCNIKLEKSQKIFCSLQCQADHRLALSIQAWLISGEVCGGNKSIRNYLKVLNGDRCSVCGIQEHNGKPITFEVDHINGDSTNDNYDNVCLICPNCHSQTDTYKGRNRGKGRHSRAQRYRDGKSY